MPHFLMHQGQSSKSRLLVSKNRWFDISGYRPHAEQVRIHANNARFRVVVAGRRWGKSLLAAKEAEVMILAPDTRGWIVSRTYQLGDKVFREIYSDLIMKFGIETVRRNYSLKGGSMYLEFPWGSSVEVKSADHPDSLLGEGLDWLIFDECAACAGNIWEQYLRPTLSDRQGWAIFISTPRGYNWFYDLYMRGQDVNHHDWSSWRFPTSGNVFIPGDEIEAARKTLPKGTFRQEYGAEFIIQSAQVYADFSEDINITDILPERGWLRYRAIDFGYENPFVCLYIAVDPEDRVYIYDEIYERHITIEAMATMMNKGDRLYEETEIIEIPCKWVLGSLEDTGCTLSGSEEYRRLRVVKRNIYEFTVCDPSGKGQRATLMENGIITIANRSDKLRGIELVRQQLIRRGDGKPGLYVHRKCINTIKEFNQYSYEDDTIFGRKEEPKKESDHAMDALRYFIAFWRQGLISQR